jgi:hypothetical protein
LELTTDQDILCDLDFQYLDVGVEEPSGTFGGCSGGGSHGRAGMAE